MVQPSFSSSGPAKEAEEASATAILEHFLDRQHQSYYEELYSSEAACLCLLRYVSLALFCSSVSPSTLLSRRQAG